MSKNIQVEGQIRLSGSATGFVEIPAEKNNGSKGTIRIYSENLNNAYNKDTVIAETNGKKSKDDELGEVKKIVNRAKKQYVGELDTAVKGDFAYVIPDDNKMYRDIKVFNPEKGTHGNKVVVQIDDFPEGKSPQGTIIKDLGEKGSHETEIQAALNEQGFDSQFPTKIEEEAQKTKEESERNFENEIKNRRDYRHITTCTIDPADAKDFDDALSIFQKDNGNFEVGIHIADVSHYVNPNTALDKEAYERSFSVYMVDRTVPMLPEILSNDLCSLNPEVDRLAFSAIFELDKKGNVQDEWFGKSVIKSDKRFAYEEAQTILDSEEENSYRQNLEWLRTIAQSLEKSRNENGAINFEKDEFEFVLDENGKPLEVVKKERLDTHKLVEEFMLLANRQVATFMNNWDQKQQMKDKGLMYRVHNEPETDRLQELKEFLKILKYDLHLREDGGVSPKELNRIIKEAKDTPEEEIVNTTTVKTMQKAMYSIKNEGHFGLAFESYTHFTSPIRRYPDLLVHRIMEAICNDKKLDDGDVAYFSKSTTHASDQEVAAAEAERDSIKYKQAEFMAMHIDEVFEGIISGVTDWGLYVQLIETGADGLVQADSLEDDFYIYEEKRHRYIGDKNKKTYALGDRVRVKVLKADIEEKKIDLKIIE